jgi:Tfp pilus assembly protein PilF
VNDGTPSVPDEAIGGPFVLKPNARSMFQLALGSATTVATMMVLPDAVGIIPVVPDPLTWLMRMIGLWLSGFIQWTISFLALLHFARFVGGGILLTPEGIRIWRFGKEIKWGNIKALTVETQPLFSAAFRLKPVARRLLIFEEKPAAGPAAGFPGQKRLVPHPVPSFQFLPAEFISLFAHLSQASFGFVPHSLDSFVLSPGAEPFLKAASDRARAVRKILSVVIAVGLVMFLGRRASENYFFNSGNSYFRKENYAEAAKLYALATKVDPTFAAGWDLLARAEFRMGDIKNSEQHWHRALQMKPDLIESKLGLSNIYLRRNELDKAERLLNQCALLAPHNSAVYLNQAELYVKLGEKERVHHLLEVVTRESSENAEALARAAKIYLQLKEDELARGLAERALQIDPANASAKIVIQFMRNSH